MLRRLTLHRFDENYDIKTPPPGPEQAKVVLVSASVLQMRMSLKRLAPLMLSRFMSAAGEGRTAQARVKLVSTRQLIHLGCTNLRDCRCPCQTSGVLALAV